MIFDKENLFSEDQAITATANSTNVIDLGADNARVISPNEKQPELFVQVTEDFDNLTSLQVSLYKDNDEAFGSATLVKESAAVPLAELVAGYQFLINGELPLQDERYLRLTYTVVGAAPSQGKIMAGLVLDRQTNK